MVLCIFIYSWICLAIFNRMNKAHCAEWLAYTSATGFAHMRSIVRAYGLI